MPIVKNTIVTAVFVGMFFLSSAMCQDVKRVFTLSDEDLMSLDVYQNSDPNNDPNAPRIVGQRDIAGPGVEFDIYFPPDNKRKDNYELSYVSCNNSGEGTLVDIDVNDFDAFALKFTLIAIDGKNDPNAGGTLTVGALVDGAYRPECISFSEGDEVISITGNNAKKTSVIGFHMHKLSPDGWNSQGNTVTIRVEAAPNSEML